MYVNTLLLNIRDDSGISLRGIFKLPVVSRDRRNIVGFAQFKFRQASILLDSARLLI
jgi:hypothetical protein